MPRTVKKDKNLKPGLPAGARQSLRTRVPGMGSHNRGVRGSRMRYERPLEKVPLWYLFFPARPHIACNAGWVFPRY